MNWITSSKARFPAKRLFLIEGAPGSGKTTLALQFLLADVKNFEQGFYVTFSESEDEIRAVAESHGWTLDGIHLQELSTLGDRLKNGEQYTIFQPADVELSETVQRVIDDVRRLKPERVVIDSLSEIRLVARDPLRYHRQILALKEMLSENERVLQEAHEELERRVLQRTMEITKVNSDLRREVSERLNAENALRQLSQNIVRLQDEERRRIARELHDSAGQYLSAVTLTLGQLARRLSKSDDRNKELVQESLDLVGDCIKEVRTMSYLLHPPVLDDFGLVSALRWYVEGFSQRSGINVRLDLAEEFPRFHRELETALFRIVQEGLTNVHRHSGGQKACVELKIHERQINTTITDNGHGMSQEVLCEVGKGQGGVGLMGMYERVKKLGGTIHIVSTKLGTTIEAQLPFMEMRESSAAAALS